MSASEIKIVLSVDLGLYVSTEFGSMNVELKKLLK